MFSIIERIAMPFKLVKPKIDMSVRKLCRLPYYNHPEGCPNFNHKAGCPPHCDTIEKVIDLSKKTWAIWNIFDFAKHCHRMELLHPKWSKLQVECCLYWQNGARKRLETELNRFTHYIKWSNIIMLRVPEAHDVNVTATMEGIDEMLEWPPKIKTYQVAIAGMRLS